MSARLAGGWSSAWRAAFARAVSRATHAIRLPVSLKLTVPLILLGFAATLSAFNLLYHVPRAELAAENDSRKRLAQEMSRLQSTLEYLLLKGDLVIAQHQVSVLAHNHEYAAVALTDDGYQVIAATRRAWLDRPISEAMRQFDYQAAEDARADRRARVMLDDDRTVLHAYAGILLGGDTEPLRPSRAGTLLIVQDLTRAKAEARANVVEQSMYWAGWVTALAAVLWLAFHFMLTRRTAMLVRGAERLAAGDLSARSHLRGDDELGRLGRAFDAMARDVARRQSQLQDELAERSRIQDALTVSESSYRAIFDAAEDATFVLDIEGSTVIDVNPKACSAYGFTREELLQLDTSRLHPGEMSWARENVRELIARAREEGAQHFEWHLRHRDGSMHWEDVYVKRVNIGGHERLLALTRDITERKHAAEELARQREALYQREKLAALGSLLAGVAHELNNPLAVVVARAVMLEEQSEPAVRGAAQKIRSAAERCARIVRSFLAMARQQPPKRGPVSVDDVIAAALDIAGYAIRTSGITVETAYAPGIPPILADADQLHQVLLNLLINAQQSLLEQPQPRRIRLETRYDAERRDVRIVVADNGPGVPPQVRERVFEPYFTTKPTGIGTGVGLAVSLGIVEAHGGRLTLDSPASGGAAFTITLPVGSVGLLESPATAPERPSVVGRSVLVVDDEPEIRETLTAILTAAQNRVVTAASGREALAALDGARFDAILTDLRMPDVDGCALFHEIERRWPAQAARVAFVTGDALASSLRDFVAASGRPVLEKPFLPSDVRRVVAELAA